MDSDIELLDIVNIYKDYICDNSFVYKPCNNYQSIIILQKLSNTITNEDRHSINPNSALYKADVLKVILIFNKATPHIMLNEITYRECEHYNYVSSHTYVTYKVGETISSLLFVKNNKYDYDYDDMHGIKYFKTFDCAFYRFYTRSTGKYIVYCDDGNKTYEGYRVNGKLHGLQKSFYDNCKKEDKKHYHDGILHGKWTSYKKMDENYLHCITNMDT